MVTCTVYDLVKVENFLQKTEFWKSFFTCRGARRALFIVPEIFELRIDQTFFQENHWSLLLSLNGFYQVGLLLYWYFSLLLNPFHATGLYETLKYEKKIVGKRRAITKWWTRSHQRINVETWKVDTMWHILTEIT